MRTTVTLDPDTEALIRRRMRERGLTFKEAINEAIRESASGADEPFRTGTVSMGESTVSLDRALQVVADLEDDELIRRMGRVREARGRQCVAVCGKHRRQTSCSVSEVARWYAVRSGDGWVLMDPLARVCSAGDQD